MTEKKADYITDAYITRAEIIEGLDMLGRGYEHPAVVITPPTTEMVMGDAPGFIQTKTPAFVKMSTAFKKQMKNLKGAKLSIWLYLALSINDGGKAYPSIETIGRDTGYSNRSIIDVTKELEEEGYLTIRHRGGTSNLYTVNGFVAIGKAQPSSEISSHPEGVNFPTRGVNFTTERCEETSLKPDINQTIKPEFNNNSDFLKTICRLYEGEIGILTPMIADAIRDAEKEYPAGWVEDAIQAAARRNARNWSYVEAILKRWKRDGKNAPFQPAGNYKGNGKKTDKTFWEQLEAA